MTDSDTPRASDDALVALSALHDGEADHTQLHRACQAWRSDASARQAWHAWAVVGDVLRSEDLAQSAAHDSAFLQRLRQRMQDEPVVLAPTSLGEPTGDDQQVEVRLFEHLSSQAVPELRGVRRRWAGPTAVVAGFVAVAGALVMFRAGTGEPVQVIADKADPLVVVAPSASGTGAGTEMLVRNADLDRYLAAHREFAQGPAFAAPGGLRQVVATPSSR
jgi:sigma-E factor negative regulatory protein RseA